MKKKLAATLSVVLILGLAVLGILAYLTSEASDVNVMTLGNVDITQHEQQKNADGELEPFEQAKDLYPGTEISKIVTVENTGKSDCYVRTLVAFEDIDSETFMMNYKVAESGYTDNTWYGGNAEFEIDGTKYVVVEFIHKAVVKKGETTGASLSGVNFGTACTNEDMELLGDTYDILVLSQAVQTAGFTDAKGALDTAFGDVTDENAAKWFGGMVIPVVVETADEFEEALANGDAIVLADDITLTEATTVDEAINLNLNGHTLTTSGLDLTKGGSVENGTIASGADTKMTPHLKISGGTIVMDDVTVDVNHHLNANVYWTEATGMEVMNATAVLNDCEIKINNTTKAQWVYSYAISLNNAQITVNGGKVIAECVAGTAANGPTNPNAISAMGECTATLNNVDVDATYYATTVNGHLTINTTDKAITIANIVDNNGGSHTLNYID